jgi:Asp-tRNA(Asn)/Glu-tRNA(Gln) amidotransferase A subunit family amidase
MPQVCETLLAKMDQSNSSCNPPVNAFVQYDCDDVMAQARASAARYAERKPIGPLDGTPVAVKDTSDVAGYETRAGTSFINRGNKCVKDSVPTQRLRDQGAIIIGKTSMQEMGSEYVNNEGLTC